MKGRTGWKGERVVESVAMPVLNVASRWPLLSPGCITICVDLRHSLPEIPFFGCAKNKNRMMRIADVGIVALEKKKK